MPTTIGDHLVTCQAGTVAVARWCAKLALWIAPPIGPPRARSPRRTGAPTPRRATSSATRACSRERTQVMRSSAMRDLMAITARPEVISLAGGLPDTSTFPPESFAAQMTRIAQESLRARRSSTGRPRASRRPRTCIREVMAAEGMAPDPDDLIVTTGGQQAIDLIAKTLVDPGDVGDLRGADLPGRGAGLLLATRPTSHQVEIDDDGMRIDELEELLDRLARRGPAPEVHLLGAELPEPGRGDDVRGAPPAAGRARPRARDAGGRGQPLRPAALRGRARSRRSTSSTAATTSSTSARSRRSSRPGSGSAGSCAPPPVMEKIVLGKQAADLCTSTLTQYFVREYFAEGRWREYVDDLREIYRDRRDAMLEALERHFPRAGELDAARGRPVRLGDAARLHRHHRPAGQGAARERRLRPRRGRLRRRARRLLDAAQLLGLGRGRDPRGHPPDRRGGRRAGRALRDDHRRAPDARRSGRTARSSRGGRASRASRCRASRTG